MSVPDPVRLTKGRANALLEFATRGIEDEANSLHQLYGVRLIQTRGEIVVEVTEADLLTEDEKRELDERLALLGDTLAAMAIIRRRYT